jgi:dCMP deaminase
MSKDLKHMLHARFIGDTYSKDQSTKVGALIMSDSNEPLSWGYNGLPRGVNDSPEDHPERHDRTKVKYFWAEHSERNAIYSAARNGHKLFGSKIYVSRLPTCADCARAIVQAGIKEVFIEAGVTSVERWHESWKLAKEIYDEAGVTVTEIPMS